MALALTVNVPAFEAPARYGSARSTTWSQKIATMSRRLEARWMRGTPTESDPETEVQELLCASCTARAEFDGAMLEHASMT